MMKFFKKRTADGGHTGLQRFGCVSRRDKDANRRDNDQVIVVREAGGELFVSKFSRKASLETLRLSGLIRTCAANYQARTQRLADLQYTDASDEIKIGSGFINYLKGQKVSLQDKCAAYTIDSTGTVAGITALEKDVAEAAVSIEGFRAKTDQSCPVEVETRGRAALRLYLKFQVPPRAEFDSLPETVCAAVVEDHGYSLVFWNEQKGICWEVEQPFGGGNEEKSDNWAAAADEIRRSLSQASLESIGIAIVNHVAIAASDECLEFLRKELEEENIAFENIGFEEGINFNLTEGSQALGESRIDAIIAAGLMIEETRLPAINLNRDLEAFIREREQERVRVVERKTAVANRNMTILVIAPACLVFACCLIWYAMLWIQDGYVDRRLEKANAEDARLTEVKKQIQRVKESSDKVQIVSESIGALKKRQPANFLLLMALNRKWASLGSWQIDEITSKADGTVTIKGKTNNDDNLTEFAKSLDFSDDFESVKVSKGEGLGIGSGAALPGLAQNTFGSNGIIKFAVETRYRPLAAFGTAAPAAKPNVQPAAVPPPQVAGGNLPKPPNS